MSRADLDRVKDVARRYATKLSDELGDGIGFVLLIADEGESIAVVADVKPRRAMEVLFMGIEWLQARHVEVQSALNRVPGKSKP